MKQLLSFFLFLPFFAHAQEQDTIAVKAGTEVASKYGTKFRIGDTLYFGRGSLPSSAFAYIKVSPNSFFGMKSGDVLHPAALGGEYAGRHGVIKEFYHSGWKKSGKYWSALIAVGGLSRYIVTLDAAIDAGEILDPRKPVPQNINAVIAPAPVSTADEIKKLAELRKEGLLTEEEFQEQKKKLLEK